MSQLVDADDTSVIEIKMATDSSLKAKKIIQLHSWFTCISICSTRYVTNSCKFIDRVLLLSHKLPATNCENEIIFPFETSMKADNF